ncbi:MAG: HEAT repeat domain-containing protein [Candidatus Obscuribacterales bacterium]|nr:HEAT repeat domain-containing protein [Candidatus Obscuribacterales bacterium]
MPKKLSFTDQIDRLGCKRCDTRRAELKNLLGAGINSYKSLVAAILDPNQDPKVRRTAAWLTGRFPAKRSGELALVAALSGEDTDLCIKAADSVGNLKCKEAIPELSALIQGEDKLRRYAALNALSNIQGKKAASILLECLQCDEPELSWEAAKVIVRFKSKKITEQLIDVLTEHPNKEVRSAAAYALGFKGDRDASRPLMEVACDEYEVDSVRTEALEAVGMLAARSHATTKQLSELLRHASIAIRFWAAYALASIAKPKDKRVISELKRLEKEDNALLVGWWTVSTEARFALASIRGEHYAEQEWLQKEFDQSVNELELTDGIKIQRKAETQILHLSPGETLKITAENDFEFSTTDPFIVHKKQPMGSTVIEKANGDNFAFANGGFIQLILGNKNIKIAQKIQDAAD